MLLNKNLSSNNNSNITNHKDDNTEYFVNNTQLNLKEPNIEKQKLRIKIFQENQEQYQQYSHRLPCRRNTKKENNSIYRHNQRNCNHDTSTSLSLPLTSRSSILRSPKIDNNPLIIGYHRNSSSYIGGATDFSIEAIMARGGNASSRQPSERSLSPASVERYPDAEDDVDVNVVDCSDSETSSRVRIMQSPSSNKNKQNVYNDRNFNINAKINKRQTSPSNNNHDNEDFPSPEVSKTIPKILGSCNCDDLHPVQCHLETKELWDKFHDLGTEMIITKTGRFQLAPL